MDTLTVSPTLKQYEAYQALNSKDIVFLGGGAGGGKSWFICESRLIKALAFPGYKSFIGREELKRLMSSTFLTFVKVCAHHKIPQEAWKLNGQYNYIEFANGSRIDLLDLKFLPSDPLYERFGSTEYTDGAIEEAGEVDFRAFDVLKTRINRHKNEELGVRATLLITGNPKKNWTYQMFYKPWREGTLPDNIAFIQSLYSDNPYSAETYGKNLGSITDRAMRERLMLGNWDYDDDANSLLTYLDIMSIFEVDGVKGAKYMTIDPAFQGKDEMVIYIWDGWIVEHCYHLPKVEHDTMIQLMEMYAKTHGVNKRHIVSDATGEGAYIPQFLKGVRGFIGGGSPLENDLARYDEMKRPFFLNLRSQCIYEMAQKIKQRKVAFKVNDPIVREKLVEELQQWKLKYLDNDRKIQIISKEEIKENIGRSTDYSDALYERAFFDLNGERPAPATNSQQIKVNYEQPFNKWSL